MGQRVLITGMSATGKSATVDALRSAGFRAVDMDVDGWSRYDDDGEWVWQEERVRAMLRNHSGPLFVAGCAPNQGQFYGDFDHVVLLSVPRDVMVERLARRSGNDFGKRDGELEKILADLEEVEPLLRAGADTEIDTRLSLAKVTEILVRLVSD